jgi:hypothetical protein
MSLSLSLVGEGQGWWVGKSEAGVKGGGGGQERLYLPLRTLYGVPTAIALRFSRSKIARRSGGGRHYQYTGFESSSFIGNHLKWTIFALIDRAKL